MAQQHDERSQSDFTADEANTYYINSAFFTPRLSIFIQLRFAVALLSVVLLLIMSVVNMVIERMLETVMYGLGPYNPSGLRLLFYTLPPLGMTVLLTLLLIWLNGFVGHRARQTTSSNTFGAKLVVTQPPSISQGLVLALLSAGLVASLWYTVIIYLRFGPYLSDVLYEVMGARLAAIPLVTAALLTGAAFWINVLFHRTRF